MCSQLWPLGRRPVKNGGLEVGDWPQLAVAHQGLHLDTPAALEREWRSFDRHGSAIGALVNLGWVVLAAYLALLAEKLVRRGVSVRIRRILRARAEVPTLAILLRLLLCDVCGLGAFSAVFVYSRHWLIDVGVTVGLIILAVNVLIRWRVATQTVGVLFVLLVLERLTERAWQDADPDADRPLVGTDRLVAFSMRRLLRVLVLLAAVLTLVWIWIEAIELPAAEAAQVLHAATVAVATLLVAFVAWVLGWLAIDRNLQ